MTVETCEAVRVDLPALHYGDLEGPEKAQVERHLEGCAPCRAALEAVRETAAGLDRIPVVMPSQSEWVRLDARIEARVAPLRAQRFARSYGRFQLLSRVAAAALIGTLTVLSAGLYLRARDYETKIDQQARELASLRGDVEHVRALALTGGPDLPVVAAYDQACRPGTEADVRERIADLLARFPKEKLADQAYLALQKTGVPTPRQVGAALTNPIALFPQQPIPETATLEGTWRAVIAQKRAGASTQDPRVGAFTLFRCGQQAEVLGDRPLAAELYREATKLLPGGPIAGAAEERLAALGK